MILGKLATQRPVTLSMTAFAVVIFGSVSLSRLPVSLLPELQYPTLTVECRLPGAAPLEVENLVGKPIEEAVGVVSGVERLSSMSRSGLVQVSLEFGWDRDMDVAALDVRQKLDMVALPRDAEKPRVLRYDPSEEPIIRLALVGSRNLARLRHYAEQVLKKRLESVEGVAAVKVLGGDVEEIQVDVDEGRVGETGLTHEAIITALREANVSAAGGSLYEEEARYLVRTSNELRTVEDVASVIVLSEDGRQITIADVATVSRSVAEREVITRVGGREAVELRIYKEGDANAVRVSDQFQAALGEARRALPDELSTILLFDQSRFIRASIDEVRGNALLGGAIAILVLLLFLRDARSTLIIGLSIPISIVATFFLMHQLGVTLNVMSLGGLALGVGMLVDNAIVVLEAIVRRREEGVAPMEAAIQGTSDVGMAVTASTLTTVVVFLPIIFIEGVAAQLFRDQALTVSGSLLASLLVSLTLIPMLAARLHRTTGLAADDRGSWLFRALTHLVRGFRNIAKGLVLVLAIVLWPVQALFRRCWPATERAYPWMLKQALARPWHVAAAGALLVVAALGSARWLALELIPPMQQGEFTIDIEAPEGTPLEGTEALGLKLEEALAASPHVESVFTTIGSDARRQSASGPSGQNRARLHVVMKERGDREAEDEVARLAREALAESPGLSYRFDRPGRFTFRAPIEIEIFGDDVEKLAAVAQDLSGRLASLPFLADVATEARMGNPEIQVRFDRDRLARLHIEPAGMAAALRSRLHGEVATRITESDRDIDVRVRGKGLRRSSEEDLKALTVTVVEGAPVRLGQVASVKAGAGPIEIRRIGQRRAAVITASLAGLDLGAATGRIMDVLRSVPLPAGVYPPELSGQSKELQRSLSQLVFALCLAAFLVYFVMASEFESLLHPFLIMMTVPMAIGGALLALAATGQPLSVVAIIGIVMLAGIAVNNAIVLVDCINQLRRSGTELLEAIERAGRLRLRPIFMTTGTTVLGLLPMALGLGEGAELRMPLAIAVMGGLLVSTFLTLVVVPSIYLLVERRGASRPALEPMRSREAEIA